jgi:hypothetical protein
MWPAGGAGGLFSFAVISCRVGKQINGQHSTCAHVEQGCKPADHDLKKSLKTAHLKDSHSHPWKCRETAARTNPFASWSIGCRICRMAITLDASLFNVPFTGLLITAIKPQAPSSPNN